jgi:hypothetical protein
MRYLYVRGLAIAIAGLLLLIIALLAWWRIG